MITFMVLVHVFVCIALILIVLLQTGKGADMGAAFGGSTQTVFGAAGPAPFLGKITTIAAVIFMVTSLSLAYFSANPFGDSLVKDMQPVAPQMPGTPAGMERAVKGSAAQPVAGKAGVSGEAKTVVPAPDNIPEKE